VAATPYTAHDTPALVARIDGDLAVVLAAVRAADPRLRALVLTGGFARGEGTVLDGAPQNDYDFVAVRGLGPPKTPYAQVRAALEERLGLHVDLAAVPAWRLRWTAPSIFWYETALRGRTLWGADLLQGIPTREADQIGRTEGLRLLANRAAGLLLATEMTQAHAVRIQSAKAILAALDAHLLAGGSFAPSQTERWTLVQGLIAARVATPAIVDDLPLWTWAHAFKADPAAAVPLNSDQAWEAARGAILAAIPAALERAGLPSLEAHRHGDRLLDRLAYGWRARNVDGAHRLLLNPSSRLRIATLRLLEATPQRRIDRREAVRCLAGLARVGPEPLRTLEGLRAAALQ
jgi:hypothetical protein